MPWCFTGTSIGGGHEQGRGKGDGFQGGEPKTGPSFSLGNRMLDGNASEPALHWICSRMPEWDLKEVQNINDLRGIF